MPILPANTLTPAGQPTAMSAFRLPSSLLPSNWTSSSRTQSSSSPGPMISPKRSRSFRKPSVHSLAPILQPILPSSLTAHILRDAGNVPERAAPTLHPKASDHTLWSPHSSYSPGFSPSSGDRTATASTVAYPAFPPFPFPSPSTVADYEREYMVVQTGKAERVSGIKRAKLLNYVYVAFFWLCVLIWFRALAGMGTTSSSKLAGP